MKYNNDTNYPNPSGDGTEPASAGSRVFIYIDGFNLYFRSLKNHPETKWLDPMSLAEKLLSPSDNIIKIKYFTARVNARPNDPSQPTRQDTYLKALKAHIPTLDIIYGQFQSHKARAWKANGTGTVKIIKTEEKGSDVNLAVHILQDAWLDLYDTVILVSNDSDLAQSLRFVKNLNKKLGWFLTDTKRPSRVLSQLMDFKKPIRKGALIASQLPNPILGTTITKPITWI